MEFQYGTTINELPEGYVPLQQWPEYDLGHLPLSLFNPELVGKDPRGVRWGFWPFTFEEYVGDTEPDLSISDPKHHARNRLILWRTLVRKDKPKGWSRLEQRPSRLEGFAMLDNTPHYCGWDESAKRYRIKWLQNYRDKTYRIVRITYSDFKAAYTNSPVSKSIKSMFVDQIGRQSQRGLNKQYEFHAVEHVETAAIAAAMCVLNSPTHQASYYVTGFYNPAHGHVPAMVALMDRWFEESQKHGMRFLHFGEFWMPGKPKNWKGFSLFKAKFGLHYIAYPPTLVRFARGKLF